MKVLNLQCQHGHGFEGWFSSEDDFQHQLSSGLLACPMCGDPTVTKLPSAPRLNLGAAGTRHESGERTPESAGAATGSSVQREGSADNVASLPPQVLQAAWLHVVRRVMASAEDVGQRFAEEARKMHYGECEARGIRGHATPQQTEELLDEGIAVMPLPVPDGFKDTLQ